MSRQTWMDRTIETARDADIRMPWSRTARTEDAPQPSTPLPLRARS